MAKTAVLLINLGSPDKPTVPAVYRYLTQFLNDPRVIDIPALGRWILVNLIIVPIRCFASTKIYKKLWTEEGSPLIVYGHRIKEQLQAKLGEDADVYLAMRYQNPSIRSQVKEMEKHLYTKIVVIPLFPHYASASTGSAVQKAMEEIAKMYVIPQVEIIDDYYDLPELIEIQAENAQKLDPASYDHIIMSYHGLPMRQLNKVYPEGLCDHHDCEHGVEGANRYCYKAQCYTTTHLIAEKLGLKPEQYSVGFQSRLGKGWVTPFTDKLIEERAEKGDKRLLVFSPAFVSDCLETTIEIGDEYQEDFEKLGGEKVQLVPSLNDDPRWVAALERMVRERL